MFSEYLNKYSVRAQCVKFNSITNVRCTRWRAEKYAYRPFAQLNIATAVPLIEDN